MDRNETRRLKALRSYRILDTDPEACFDDLSLLASYICETPIALLTLVDENRQWFKARTGIEVEETPRDIAFCSHAIERADLFIVPDTLEDGRFRNNPLVVGNPHIRFYAGAPLITPEGHALGTLCVIDRKPRRLTSGQLEALDALSHQAVAQLELRRNLMELKTALKERDFAEDQRQELVEELQSSLTKVKRLSRMIPLCSACKFEMTIKAELSSIDTVAQGVMQMLSERNWDSEQAFGVEIALREALANAMKHGCRLDPTKDVQCCVTCEESGEILIVVRDPGSGFDEVSLRNPIVDENLMRTSGRGIFLINELMDEALYADGGRELHMRKKAPK